MSDKVTIRSGSFAFFSSLRYSSGIVLDKKKVKIKIDEIIASGTGSA